MQGLLLIPDERCFIEVAKHPLLHRVLLTGQRAGVHDWLIVARHEAHRLQVSLAAAPKLAGISWQVFDLQSTSPGVLTQALPSETVLVCSGTAAYDRRPLVQLQRGDGTSVCVTTSPLATTDPMSEGVALQNGSIATLIPTVQSTWYTTDMLRCPGELLSRILPEMWNKLQSSSTPVAVILHALMQVTTVKALDISQHAWVPLTAPLERSVATAEAHLIRGLGRDGDSPLVRLIDRRISQAITKRLVHTTITPNQITLVSAGIGLSGALLLAHPSRLWQVLGSLLFLLSTIIDGCDGEIARLTFQESEFGAKLDVIMDNVVHIFLFSCIALGLYRQEQHTLYLLLGGLTLGGVLLSMALYLPYLWHSRVARQTVMRLHEVLASRDFAYLLPVFALLHLLHWFLWAATIGTYLFALALGGIYLYRLRHPS